MNVSAVEPTNSAAAAQSSGAVTPAAKKAPPAAPAPTVAALSTPAATVTVSSVPATVKAEDRTLYMQILKSVGGNVNAALAALAAAEAKEADS
jgi:hypothetical protein